MKRWLLLVVLASCGNHDRPKVEETERHNRVIDPPAKEVRALPPHAIRADGVGPYKVGASLSDLNDLLRSGPHIAQIDIPNVIRVSVLRAEDNNEILIGGEPQGKATFVSVVGGDVARTESGIHVGSTRAELVRALGAPEIELARARDPRIVVPAAMPELRAVLAGDRIVGLVVAPRDPASKEASDACVRPVVDGDRRFGACLSGTGDVVTVEGDELSVRSQDDKLLALQHVPNISFAAPVRGPDGRDELYVVTHTDDAETRTWSIVGYRLEGTHLGRVVDLQPVYQLTAANARWIGSELRDLDLYLEVSSRSDGIEVGGLLTTHAGEKLRDLLVLAPVQVRRLRAKSAPPEAGDAGVPAAAPAGADAGP